MPSSFNIEVSTGSSTPIYKQITDQVRMAVASGRLNVADQLPSVRALAEELVINPNTVARAYADLAREGIIEARQGRGVFIIQKRRVFSRGEARRRLEPLMDALIAEAFALDFTPDELKESLGNKLDQLENEKKSAA